MHAVSMTVSSYSVECAMLGASKNPSLSQGLQPSLSCGLHQTGISILSGWSSNDCSSWFSTMPDIQEAADIPLQVGSASGKQAASHSLASLHPLAPPL